jgi:glucose/mannose transport system substrate-binding protein
VGLAGCGGSDDGGSDDGGSGDGGSGDGGSGDGGSGGGGTGDDTLEVIHGWAGGDGEAAINALIETFEGAYSDIPTDFQAVGASANVNLNATILRRLNNNNPMSSFANWPGVNLQRYEGALADIEEDVWEAEGYLEEMQDRVIDLCRFNDQLPAVPIGSHRMNNLFYSVDAFDQAGLSPEDIGSPTELLDAYQTIEDETEYTPMGQAKVAPWTALQLWVQVLVGEHGTEAFMNWIDGNADREAIVDALDIVREIEENFISDDASSLSFTDVGGRMIDGDFATNHQGNWIYGQFRADDNFNYKEDWDWMPFPNTDGIYHYHVDAFIMPADNPSREESIEWLKHVGTKEAQIAFNNPKGSVPLRTDIDPSELTDFLALTYEDLTSSEEYPPTLAHGLAVPPEQLGSCREAISQNMMGPYDVESAADALIDVTA